MMKQRGNLQFRYNHVNERNEIRGGQCYSIPEILPDRRLRLHESWKWTDTDQSEGKSIIEEIK